MKIRTFFTRHADGSWEPTQELILRIPAAGKVAIAPGDRFRPGVLLMGVDIAALCEQDTDVSKVRQRAATTSPNLSRTDSSS